MLIPHKSQKFNARKKEHPTSKAQKSQKFISITCANVENKPKGLNLYINKESKDVIRKQK